MRRTGYLNGVLTVIAVLLALVLLDRHLAPGAPTALGTAVAAGPADEPVSDGLISAAEQRKMIISELRRLASKFDRLEARLNSGINVKVTEMPELKLPASGSQPQKP